MFKKIIIGIVFGLILAFFSFALLSGVDSAKEELTASQYYNAVAFDFVIPKPWYSQIPEIREMPFIEKVEPFYLTGKELVAKGKSSEVNLYLLEQDADIEITPYAKSLLVEGKVLSGDGTIEIDERTAKALQLSAGDSVQTTIGAVPITLTVSGIVRTNQLSSSLTAALYYSEKVKEGVESIVDHLAYSGAFVKATDISSAENYFNKQYRAMGKVGERSWYKDDAAYEYMKKSIGETSISREITNISQLRANANSNIKETKNQNSTKTLSVVALVFFVNLFFWIIVLLVSSGSYRTKIQHGASTSSVIAGFVCGEVLSIVILIAGLVLLRGDTSTTRIGLVAVSGVVSMVLSILLTRKIVGRS